MFDLGLGLLDAENIDIALTENSESPFLAVILIVGLVSLHYQMKKNKNRKQVSNLTIEIDGASNSIPVKVQQETSDFCLILCLILALLSKKMAIIKSNITDLPKCEVFFLKKHAVVCIR